MKKALIFGVTGHDGSYLAKLLLEKKYMVFGTSRTFSPKKLTNLKFFGINSKIQKITTNFNSFKSIESAIHFSKPDEIYNLAGVSSVLEPFKNPLQTAKINGLSVLSILETIRMFYPKTKFFQASSSEMFAPIKGKLTESSPFNPITPYAISKVFAHEMTIQYRKNFKLFSCCGILFNHESPLRGEEFVTRKIVRGLIKILKKEINCLELGNINSKRDWGYAKEYVEAMWKMLQQKKPEDYVIATGKAYSIKYFIDETIKVLNLKAKWVGIGKKAKLIDLKSKKTIVKINPKFFRPSEVNVLKGNYKKAHKKLNWKPRTNLKALIKIMVSEELKYYSNIQ